MSGSGSHPDPSSDAVVCAAVSTVSLTAAEHSSRDTAKRTPAGLLQLPTELRLRIYKMLIHPRGVIDVDSFYAARTAGKCSALRFLDLALASSIPFSIILTPRLGSRTTVVSHAIGLRLRDLWVSSPDALSIISINKQLYREAADLLYANTVFRIADLPAVIMFLDMLRPTDQAIHTSLELNLCSSEEDFFEDSDAYEKLGYLSNESSFTVAIDTHILDVVAVWNGHFRPAPDHGCSEESMDIADKHLDCLRRIAWGLASQVEDAARKRERLKIIKITRWIGPSARQYSILQSGDYDEIQAGVLPMIEQELDANGWCG
jgi:hypothetical protein